MTLPPSRADCLEICEPHGTPRACTGISSPFTIALQLFIFFYFYPTYHIVSLPAIFLFRHFPILIYLIHTHNYSKLYHVPKNGSHGSVDSTVTGL